MNEAGFRELIGRNPYNMQLLARLRGLPLKDCWLVAGCLFQAVWNAKSGRPAAWGIKDYDVFYHDDADLSWAAEDAVIRQVRAATADLPIAIEVKNQASVHLWYAEKFGANYPQLVGAQDGIDRYLLECTCAGIAAASGEVYAPNGFAEMAKGVLRMNPRNPRPELFRQKAESYQSRWDWLTIAA